MSPPVQRPAPAGEACLPPPLPTRQPPLPNLGDRSSLAAPPFSAPPVSAPPVSAPPLASPAVPQVQVDDEEERPHSLRRWTQQGGSFFGSLVVHLLLILALGLIAVGPSPEQLQHELDRIVIHIPPNSLTEKDLLALEVNQSIRAQADQTAAEFAEQVVVGDNTDVGSGMERLDLSLDAKIFKNDLGGAKVTIDRLTLEMPSMSVVSLGVPDGAVGDPHAVVGDYDQALDRITEELLLMLADQKVLVVWCFDQSQSMKDDQQAIRARIERIYEELGVRREARDGGLTTGVTSFGAGFWLHTKKPTSDIDLIRAAIDEVPNDPSGEEMLCQAVGRAIEIHAPIAVKEERRIAMIVVTDESGNRQNNDQYLEQAVAYAKAANARVYVLGREAVFGYPYAHQRWLHPQTGREHWLQIDRGPETALIETLQTDGFVKRTDAHPSGFGPYEQCRLARETGGIFFMLPGLEVDIVRGENREYELQAMRAYRPDLRSRPELLAAMTDNPLQQVLTRIVQDLNPYRPDAAEVMQVRMTFSAQLDRLSKELLAEQANAGQYLGYLDAAAKTLEKARYYRDQAAPRQQANYDLMYAQVLAYTARRYEYMAALDHFIRHPPTDVPYEKPGFLRLRGWQVDTDPEIVGGEVTQDYIDRSTKMFEQIRIDHAGTPWAARAEWELQRGFGVKFTPSGYAYYGPPRQRPNNGGGGGKPRPAMQRPAPIPIPNL
ncbi:vWA domain-containing protein [Lignipirellula cremea]|nr:VWA domain-containing protein [Lignipirellula cremea]